MVRKHVPLAFLLAAIVLLKTENEFAKIPWTCHSRRHNGGVPGVPPGRERAQVQLHRRVAPAPAVTAAGVAAAAVGGTETAGAAVNTDAARVAAVWRAVAMEVRRMAVGGAAGGDGAGGGGGVGGVAARTSADRCGSGRARARPRRRQRRLRVASCSVGGGGGRARHATRCHGASMKGCGVT